MKKTASIITAALITCSLFGCGNRNTAYNTPNTYQGGTNINMNQGTNNAGVTTTYKDGVYLGEGNKTSRENQAAIVTVRNGRITNVVLKTLDTQGREITNRSSSTLNNIDTYSSGNPLAGNTSGAGITQGTTGRTPSGPITNNATYNTNNTSNYINNTSGYNGTATSQSDRVRRDLSNAIISQQTYNVNINDMGSDAAAVANWKLAVGRALASSRR